MVGDAGISAIDSVWAGFSFIPLSPPPESAGKIHNDRFRA
jgi:hypothetical protein